MDKALTEAIEALTTAVNELGDYTEGSEEQAWAFLRMGGVIGNAVAAAAKVTGYNPITKRKA